MTTYNEFIYFKFKYGIFDNSIDSTYIIHMDNSNITLENIKQQLNKYKPTKKLFIYENKNLNKHSQKLSEKENNIDCYIKIFKHADKNNFENILILKNDFIFKRIILQEDINNINNFCINNKQNKFILSLGLLPIIYIPYNKYFNRVLLCSCIENEIYSKQMRIDLIKNKKNNNLSLYFQMNKYFYYKPLIFKIFENVKKIKNCNLLFQIENLIINLVKYSNKKIIPEKVYKFFYNFAFFFSIIFSLLIISIIYISINLFRKNYVQQYI